MTVVVACFAPPQPATSAASANKAVACDADKKGRRRFIRRLRLAARACGPLEVTGEEVGGGAGVLGRLRGVLLREVGGEALVEEHNWNVDGRTQRLREPLGRACLLATLAAQRQRVTDDDLLDFLLAREAHDLGQPSLSTGALDDAERPSDHAGRVGHRDARARGSEIQRHDLHASAFFAAANALGISSGALPPAWAIVRFPPPRPPTIWPISFASTDASTPTLAPSAFSCWRMRSDRSRSGPGWRSRVSARTMPSTRSFTVYAASACAFGFSLRARSRSPRSASASRARSCRSANASPDVTASIRRAPAPTELSPRMTNGPISAVERT